jgi:hypothetical protein
MPIAFGSSLWDVLTIRSFPRCCISDRSRIITHHIVVLMMPWERRTFHFNVAVSVMLQTLIDRNTETDNIRDWKAQKQRETERETVVIMVRYISNIVTLFLLPILHAQSVELLLRTYCFCTTDAIKGC